MAENRPPPHQCIVLANIAIDVVEGSRRCSSKSANEDKPFVLCPLARCTFAGARESCVSLSTAPVPDFVVQHFAIDEDAPLCCFDNDLQIQHVADGSAIAFFS
jgi:hypothetical protein